MGLYKAYMGRLTGIHGLCKSYIGETIHLELPLVMQPTYGGERDQGLGFMV